MRLPGPAEVAGLAEVHNHLGSDEHAAGVLFARHSDGCRPRETRNGRRAGVDLLHCGLDAHEVVPYAIARRRRAGDRHGRRRRREGEQSARESETADRAEQRSAR